jgi:FkbM family methyltransferase
MTTTTTPKLKTGKIATDIIDLDYHEMTVDGRPLRYVISSRHGARRTETLFTKEPTTIPWLDTMKPGEVLFDVGANVGLYSIYAGAVRRARVFSFEPESLNYAELNKNIFVNNLHETVTAYCAAISDEPGISVLHLGGFAIGWSHHDFSEDKWVGDKSVGGHVVKQGQRHKQGSVAITLDQMVASGAAPSPHHIKIDVDGIEPRVIRGASKTLRSPGLKTVLLEVDYALPDNVALIKEFEDAGWRYSPDQVRINQHEKVPFEKIISRRSRGKGGQNYIFFKDDFYMDFFRDFAEKFVPPNPL